MAESRHEGFQVELRRFRDSLSTEHRELLDELIVAALRVRPAPAIASGGRWTELLAEDVLMDIGQLKMEMDGDYQTCGGSCAKYKTNDQGEIWCVASCEGEVSDACGCHLYSYDTPKKGDPVPERKKWKHEWKPGDPKKVPEDGKTYECVCVRPKKK
jgi:hypothetical protein